MSRFLLGVVVGFFATLLVGSVHGTRLVEDKPEKDAASAAAFPITREYVIHIRNAGVFLPDTLDGQLRGIKAELDQWKKLYGIEIVGHTDSAGTELENLLLSLRRAGAVGDRLMELGVEDGLVSFDGFGELLPVADNETESGRAQNRRVQIRAYGLVDPARIDAYSSREPLEEIGHDWF